MIRIHRDQLPVPPSLLSEKIKTEKERVRKIAGSRRVASDDFNDKLWKATDIRNSLWGNQKSKCCFCENKRSRKREFDAEHFRPKAGVTGEPDHYGYWWLAYDWDNLLYACKPCNQEFKKNQFPLKAKSIRAISETDDYHLEIPVLINPVFEDPEGSLSYDWQSAYGIFVKVVGIDDDDRGYQTIKILGLNRSELLEERAEFTEILQTVVDSMILARDRGNQRMINEIATKIKKLTSSNNRFTGFRRAFFRAAGMGQYISNI